MAGKEKVENLQESGTFEGGIEGFPEWAEAAWRLYARGQGNWSALARKFNVDRRTAKMWALRFGQAVAAARRAEGSDPQQEYEAALEEIIGEAWALEVSDKATPVKVGALRIAMEGLEKLAAARGVVTKREGREMTGTLTTIVVEQFGEDDHGGGSGGDTRPLGNLTNCGGDLAPEGD